MKAALEYDKSYSVNIWTSFNRRTDLNERGGANTEVKSVD